MNIVCNYCLIDEKRDSVFTCHLFDTGEYIKHLIKEHWDVLQRLHDAVDSWT